MKCNNKNEGKRAGLSNLTGARLPKVPQASQGSPGLPRAPQGSPRLSRAPHDSPQLPGAPDASPGRPRASSVDQAKRDNSFLKSLPDPGQIIIRPKTLFPKKN